MPNLDIKRIGRCGFQVTGMRAIIDRQCHTVSFTFHVKEAAPLTGSYKDVALNKILIPQIAKALEGMEYSPGVTECVDCHDCINDNCKFYGKGESIETN